MSTTKAAHNCNEDDDNEENYDSTYGNTHNKISVIGTSILSTYR